jgi:mycoredoxin
MAKCAILVIIVLVAGLLYNHKKLQQWISPSPPVDISKQKVVLYSTKWCGYCAKTREFFAKNHIPYEDIDVELTENGRSDYAKFGANGVPIVVINQNQLILGYDIAQIADELGIE